MKSENRSKANGVVDSSLARKNCIAVAKHPAFGMWKDHDDLKDVDRATRNLRKARRHAV
jgi:hypothetical protein